ncbi:helix-hairpin-helix domain-containing protein [Alteribacillus iranensis]|uniref:Competence protein ComEA n=1 Tax=Alteribacillus iranensis TaxID=930128 RepID=A0A1I1ZA64_9BACI|nr:helix-hairpin-helix domain-containing protein [Alteribacillus iranensis]SFE28452.1 competence protein ComEA [Alteribacillus iranensis]
MKMKKTTILTLSFISIMIAGTLVFLYLGEKHKDVESLSEEEELLEILQGADEGKNDESRMEENKEKPINIIIDVKGEVNQPGVYRLTEDKRVIDAIDKAGGMTEKANPNQVNFAEKIRDEMVIYVPSEDEEMEAPIVTAGGVTNGDDKVRINYASENELETLPGIGPAKAEAIISYREENGLFTTGEELTNVSGIGEKSWEKLKDLITVD